MSPYPMKGEILFRYLVNKKTTLRFIEQKLLVLCMFALVPVLLLLSVGKLSSYMAPVLTITIQEFVPKPTPNPLFPRLG